jgi:hypothetical protein
MRLTSHASPTPRPRAASSQGRWGSSGLAVRCLHAFLVPLFLMVSLAGCPPRSGAALRAASPTPVIVASVLDLPGRPPTGLPGALSAAIRADLVARNLVPTELTLVELGPAFATRRLSPHRLSWLLEGGRGKGGLVLLIESDVQFYSQLAGRYRWTVHSRVTLSPVDVPGAAVSSELSAPVFLQFDHEREAEALVAAAAVVERQVGELLDSYLGGIVGSMPIDG